MEKSYEKRRRRPWCLLFVLIRLGLRGKSGPQRWVTRGEEAGNPIMAFHRPSSSPSFESRGNPSQYHRESLFRAVVHRLNSVVGFAEPALSLIGHTPNGPQTLSGGGTHYPPKKLSSFWDQTSGHREAQNSAPVGNRLRAALQPDINWRYVSKQPLQPEYPSNVHLRQTHIPWAQKSGGNEPSPV
jgi:hypothetical protein